jgi:phosphohistidine phosphatase
MKAQGLVFDRILASPARRVLETIDEVALGYGELRPKHDQRIYLAGVPTLLEIVRETSDDVERLLLIGHNPGMENLALLLTGRSPDRLREEIEVKYPTGTLAEIGLPAAHWRDVAEASGTVGRFIRPRDLDPELGPDQDSD